MSALIDTLAALDEILLRVQAMLADCPPYDGHERRAA